MRAQHRLVPEVTPPVHPEQQLGRQLRASASTAEEAACSELHQHQPTRAQDATAAAQQAPEVAAPGAAAADTQPVVVELSSGSDDTEPAAQQQPAAELQTAPTADSEAQIGQAQSAKVETSETPTAAAAAAAAEAAASVPDDEGGNSTAPELMRTLGRDNALMQVQANPTCSHDSRTPHLFHAIVKYCTPRLLAVNSCLPVTLLFGLVELAQNAIAIL